MKNDSGSMKIDGKEFSKNTDENNLSGSWLMSGIERRGEMRMRDVNRPRKTMKLLAGNRFQWIAYDISKKEMWKNETVPIVEWGFRRTSILKVTFKDELLKALNKLQKILITLGLVIVAIGIYILT